MGQEWLAKSQNEDAIKQNGKETGARQWDEEDLGLLKWIQQLINNRCMDKYMEGCMEG